MSTGHSVPSEGRTTDAPLFPQRGPQCSDCGEPETHYCSTEGDTDSFVCLNCQNVEEVEHGAR